MYLILGWQLPFSEVWRYCSTVFWLPLLLWEVSCWCHFYFYVHITSFACNCFEIPPFMHFYCKMFVSIFMYLGLDLWSSLNLKICISINSKSFQTLFLWNYFFGSLFIPLLWTGRHFSLCLSYLFIFLLYFLSLFFYDFGNTPNLFMKAFLYL